MTVYRACLLSPAGKLAALHRISADDDDMAVAFVRDTIKRSPAIGSFELWQGSRRIEPSKKKPRNERGGASQGRP